MSREVCGICWCPYDEETGECACAPEPKEPVAWRWGYRSVTTGEMDWRGYVEIAAHPNLRSPAIIMQPLYTAPQRKPLSEEAILSLFRTAGSPVLFARALEKMHGIGGEE